MPQYNQQKINSLLSKDLDENSSGRQVAILQAGLNSISIYTNTISGFYTYSTQEAVRSFQTKHLLPVTGKMDLVSRIRFNQLVGTKSVDDLLGEYERKGVKWGSAEKVEGTRYGWSMKMENDFHMGNAPELFDAINVYRLKKVRAKLEWSENLALFAQRRATELQTNGGVDEHKGFKEYVRYPGNRTTLGFMRLGENTSCGYRMTAIHMIEWIFAGDIPHDENQLSSRWTHVGIGATGTCVSFVFGHTKI